MKFPLRLSGFGLLFLTALLACRSTQLRNSQLSHEIKRPVLDSNPLQWVRISEAEYASVLMYQHEKEFHLRASGLVPVGHPVRQRLQMNLDRLDALIRAQDPEGTAAIPRPVIQLILTSEDNAIVYPISVCLDRSATLAGAGSGITRFWEFDPIEQVFAADEKPEQPILCLHRKASDAEVRASLDWALEGSGASFAFKNQTLVFNRGTSKIFPSSLPTQADNVVLIQMPNVINVYAGAVLKSGNEENMAFLLAHELAHYYRAHGIQPSSAFGIYYDLKKRNPTQRPQQNSQLADFAQRMESLRLAMPNGELAELSSAQRKEWQALSLEAFDKQIGQYTLEQEADELALEWILDAGLDRELPMRALLDMLSHEHVITTRRPTAEKEWPYERCLAAFRAGWKDSQDLPVFVPIGDYIDEHHSLCYRAFNMDREVKAHGYPLRRGNRTPPEFLSAEAWLALQKSLKKDVESLQK